MDGLRAVAVVPVVLFHVDPSSVPGGFLGVDVFFVISGYLITSLLVRDLAAGRLSLLDFYARRARRILPALVLTCSVSGMAGWLWLAPREVEELGWSVLSVVSFSSNLHFLASADYFGPSAEELPLLHTWSLAVEEQFYLLYPLALLAVWRARLNLTAFLLVVAVASWGLAEGAGRAWPDEAFYLLPTRAWELLAGALVARAQAQTAPAAATSRWHSGLAFLGLSTLLASMALLSPAVRCPSAWTLIPVLSTCLALRFASTENAVGRALSSAPLVVVGTISYGVYLFHQPLLVFATLRFDGDAPPALLWALAAATLPLAYGSWRLVERPLRERKAARAAVFWASALSLGGVAAVGALLVAAGESSERSAVPAAVRQSFEKAPDDCYNVDQSHTRPDWLCPVRPLPGRAPDFVFAGDSHMHGLVPAIRLWAEHHDRQGVHVAYSGCPHLLGIYRSRAVLGESAPLDCVSLNERVFRYVVESNIQDVVIASRWSYYTGRDGQPNRKLALLARHGETSATQDDSRRAFAFGVEETVRRYAEAGVRVHFVMQVPHQNVTANLAYYRAYRETSEPAQVERALWAQSIPTRAHVDQASFVREVFAAAARAAPASVAIVDLTPHLCDSARCPIGTAHRSFYFDDDHLSRAGAERAGAALLQTLKLEAPGP